MGLVTFLRQVAKLLNSWNVYCPFQAAVLILLVHKIPNEGEVS